MKIRYILPILIMACLGLDALAGTSAGPGVSYSVSAPIGLGSQAVNLIGNSGTIIKTPTASVQTAIWTADEIIVETALGGTGYKLSSASLSFNGATTGANGMDTGSMPSGGNLYIYAIYNPSTQTKAVLGTISGTGATIYPGSNMPSGYTASALIWSGVTTGTNFMLFQQFGHRVDIAYQIILNLTVGKASMTEQSVAAAVPANATNASGLLSQNQTTSTSQALQIAAESTGVLGLQEIGNFGTTGVTGNTSVINFRDLPLPTAQNVWYSTANTTASSVYLIINGYLF